MDEREQKALVIAATMKVERKGAMWVVPSQSKTGRYGVTIEGNEKFCSCPDFELRQLPCKHIMAVQYVLFRETTTETQTDGTVTTTTTEAAKVKVTYAQPSWSRYNAAQCSEKDFFLRLMHELCAAVETPEQKGAGNRRLSLADGIFAAAYKVYSGFSGRRFMSDLRSAHDDGLVGRPACYNAIFKVMANEDITPILHDMITATSKPLAGLETQFAIDSTGIGTDCFYRHYSAKWGREQYKQDYLKLHACVGAKTNVITAAVITDRNGSDCPKFKPLLEDTKQNFNVKEISADLAYSSYDNIELAEHLGVKPFIPFKTNAVAVTKSHRRATPKAWTRLFHYFQLNREEFLQHYHQRSNSETVFSMLKRVLGDTLSSKTPVAQMNECLLMVICHNIRCLIHEAFELGITPMLEQYTAPARSDLSQHPAA